MTTNHRLHENALKVMGQCCAVGSGERVVILTDPGVPATVPHALFEAAIACGGDPVVVSMQPLNRPNGSLTDVVDDILLSADVIAAPTSRAVFHSPGIQAARRGPRKARVLTLSECNEETLTEGGIDADFFFLGRIAERLLPVFEAAGVIGVRTPAGTDLEASLEGRAAFASTGMCRRPGEISGLPTVEVYIAPVEQSIEGQIVVDASCAAGIGLVDDEPITLDVAGGRVRDIRGGRQAAELERILNLAGTDSAYQVAEFGLGLNPSCRLTGRVIEDEGKYGTCHTALGSNVTFGGTSDAPMHVDMVQWKPTVTLDGKEISRAGEITVDGIAQELARASANHPSAGGSI